MVIVGVPEDSSDADENSSDHIPLPVFSNETFTMANGRYSFQDSLDSLIGLGSFGVVFRGKDEHKDRKVAIKRMLSQHIKASELNVIRSLKSAFLIGLIDVCELDESHSCVIMELCDTDLDHHIRCIATGGKLMPNNLRVLVNNLARGYMALHELKIVHRDIKPQNILVTYSPCSKQFSAAKITDFGIARNLENGEMCNVAGSPYYMAPEVGANLLKTCQYNAEVDMWSIGCLIYQCVTGEVPFNEGLLCRLFLYTACENYEAYDHPTLPEGTAQEIASIIHDLLEIDHTKRATPEDFYYSALEWTEDKHLACIPISLSQASISPQIYS